MMREKRQNDGEAEKLETSGNEPADHKQSQIQLYGLKTFKTALSDIY